MDVYEADAIFTMIYFCYFRRQIMDLCKLMEIAMLCENNAPWIYHKSANKQRAAPTLVQHRLNIHSDINHLLRQLYDGAKFDRPIPPLN